MTTTLRRVRYGTADIPSDSEDVIVPISLHGTSYIPTLTGYAVVLVDTADHVMHGLVERFDGNHDGNGIARCREIRNRLNRNFNRCSESTMQALIFVLFGHDSGVELVGR